MGRNIDPLFVFLASDPVGLLFTIPVPFYKSLYMIENPSVFSYLVDEIVNQFNMNDFSLEEIPKSFPALLCISGRPRSAPQ